MSRIYSTSDSFKARTIFIFQYFSFISCSVQLSMNISFITLGPGVRSALHAANQLMLMMLTHLSRMDFQSLIRRMSPFPMLGCWVVIFIFIQRGMCIKGLFWPPLEPKTESCFSPISSYWFVRRIAQV